MKKFKALIMACIFACGCWGTGLTRVKADDPVYTYYHGISKSTATTLSAGNIFISTNANLEDPNYNSIMFPSTLSAELRVTGTVRKETLVQGLDIDGGTDSETDKAFDVAVITKDSRFDSCTTGVIQYKTDAPDGSGWYYWCSGGAVKGAGPYSIYNVGKLAIPTFTANDISFTTNNSNIPSQGTIDPDDVIVNLLIDGEALPIPTGSYTLNSTAIDILNDDVVIDLDVFGVNLRKTLSFSAPKILNDLNYLDSESITLIDNKLESDDTYADVLDTLALASQINKEKELNYKSDARRDVGKFAATKKLEVADIEGLSDDAKNKVKSLIDSELAEAKTKITDAENDKKIVDATKKAFFSSIDTIMQNAIAQGFVDKYLTDEDVTVYSEVTSKNYAQILSGEASWNKKTDVQKELINSLLETADSKSYQELLKLSKSLDTSDGQSGFLATGDNYNLMWFSSISFLASGIMLYIVLKNKSKKSRQSGLDF